MVYLDTSILAAYYCPEPLSAKVEAVLSRHVNPAVSLLTELELYSAVSRKIRQREMERADGKRVITKYISHIAGGFFSRVPIQQHHYMLARDWIGQFDNSLRTFDALHLAVASSEELTIITADKILSKSAMALGVEVLLVS